MTRALVGVALVGWCAVSPAAPVPKAQLKSGSVIVLDDADPDYQGKAAYGDNLHVFDCAGKGRFHLSGFNNCQSIGGSRMVAVDPARKCFWVIENVAHRIRRFDLAGKELAKVENVHGSAVAVDPETGNVWVAASQGRIGGGSVEVYSPDGKSLASHPATGWDIVYDPKAKAFWTADRTLTKLSAKDGKVLVRKEVSKWTASSLGVDPTSGDVWVAVRRHPQVAGSANELLCVGAEGAAKATVALGDDYPWRVATDPKSGDVWVALWGEGVRMYTKSGDLKRRLPVAKPLAVELDPNGDGVWVLTRTDTRLLSPAGKELQKVPHKKPTDQAWLAVYPG